MKTQRSFDKIQDDFKYEPRAIEPHWQRVWIEKKIYEPDLKRATKPFYNLMMFPYPSAEGLHVGNMYAFCGSDIYGRYMRMKGFDVFEPIGLDGFGIHSENYALRIGKHPKDVAKKTEANFYRQLHAIGNSYDWSCRLETYDTNYYKWTQWIFVKMFKAGLAHREKAVINWCPNCLTVLADEQVLKKAKVEEGVFVCERCESEVEKRELTQWFFRITNYAERLLANLNHLDWSEKVKIIQRNWIGKSQGVEIEFTLERGIDFDIEKDNSIRVFTTRPDTIFGVTFMALAPEHPLVIKIIDKAKGLLKQEIQRYVDYSMQKTEAERLTDIKDGKNLGKTGIFTGFYCTGPFSKKKIPIYVADYVVTTYGTGAVMGVPAHDQRDWLFAKKYDIDIVQVIKSVDKSAKDDISRSAFTSDGVLVNSGRFDGTRSEEAIISITKYIEKHHLGKEQTMWHLRDWLISRQRYWGPPIPMIFCKSCQRTGKSWFTTEATRKIRNSKFEIRNSAHEMAGWYPVPEEDLPVELPYVKEFKPTGTGISPLAQDADFVKVKCPECGAQAKRETDVSDTFLDSAWYFLRYPSVKIENLPWDSTITKKWLPVDMYIGGAEHAVLHLLYSRFLTMVFADLGMVSGFEEPFKKFKAHGLLIAKGAKMSKSKGNIVNPDEYIEKFGADTLRCYLMFCGRFSEGGDFQDTGIEGMHRFLKRVWRLVSGNFKFQISNFKLSSEAAFMMHRTIKKVTEDIESLDYNTAISAMMEWMNALEERTVGSSQLTVDSSQSIDPSTSLRASSQSQKTVNPALPAGRREPITQDEIENLLLLLAPFAPHLTEELWSRLNGKLKISNFRSQLSIHTQPWPKYDPKLAKRTQITLVVQVNGKVRDRVCADWNISKEKAEKLAISLPNVARYFEKTKIIKTIFVPDRLINFVTISS